MHFIIYTLYKFFLHDKFLIKYSVRRYAFKHAAAVSYISRYTIKLSLTKLKLTDK